MASSNKNNAPNKYAAISRYATAASTSGWGPLAPPIAISSLSSTTLADYLKESSTFSSPMAQQRQQPPQPAQQQQSVPASTSLPWAAAVKAAEQHHLHQQQNVVSNQPSVVGTAFESRANTMGSWSSPEANSTTRNGWNADGSLKGDGTPDDGTAIWGNPSTKKTGIDWTEKESVLNSQQVNNGNTEKRIQKQEPTISSINGTEAWGTPSFGGQTKSLLISATKSQQQSKLNDNSGNTYGTKATTINTEPIGWNESSSLQGNNGSSSPPNNSIWNQLANNGKQKSTTDWLSSYSSAVSSVVDDASKSKIDELSKQLESTSLFSSISPASSMPNNSSTTPSTSVSNNPNFNGQSSAIRNSINNVICQGGNNSITDLKQMSANFINDLLDSSNRPAGGLSMTSSNNPQSQMNAYPMGMSPSRELLKQMVHQIQLAVQAGHINAQILNQPMSTPTLQLVYTLLQQIRLLQQYQEIQQRAVSKSNEINSTNLDLQISRVQQNISLLQKAITQQQAALTKNDSLVDPNTNHQQEANNFSYANISKLSTNMKVPQNNISNLISNNSIDSFKRSSLIDTLQSNSNSEPQRSAQETIDANAPIDKTVSPILQSSVNDILNTRAQSFAGQQQKAQKSGLMSAQSSSSSTSNAAWSALNSSDLVSTGWSRISTTATQADQSSNSDLMSEIFKARGWRTSDGKEESPPISLAPGANLNQARPNSASNSLKQMSETNDILNKEQSSFYDWGNGSDCIKRSFGTDSASATTTFSPSAIGGLSLQTNPWLFAPNSISLASSSGLDSLIGDGSGMRLGKINGTMDKSAGDSLGFLGSTTVSGNVQRSSSGLYDWVNMGSSASQFDSNQTPMNGKQSGDLSNSASSQQTTMTTTPQAGGRPAPPPGILSSFGSIAPSADISAHDNKLRRPVAESQASSREPNNPWSGAWFDQ